MSDRIIFPRKRLVLGFPLVGGNVLLSRRKRTPWEGCLSGLGGNVEEKDASPLHALQREAKQEAEIDIKISDMLQVAQFKVFPEGKEMRLLDVFLILDFRGDPTETEEMGPHDYYPISSLPINQMVSGDEFWVRHALSKKFLMGEIYRSADAERLVRDIQFYFCSSF